MWNRYMMTDEIIEDLDMFLLYAILDFLGGQEGSIPSDDTIDQIIVEQDEEMRHLVADTYRLWCMGELEIGQTDRPQICLECSSNNCTHLDEDQHYSRMYSPRYNECGHKLRQWKIDNNCIECIFDQILEENTSKKNAIVEIWDTRDMAQYFSWMTLFDLKHGNWN